MRYFARANVVCDGQHLHAGLIYTLPASSDVSGLVVAGLLIPEQPDGSFPEATQERRRCCGQ